MPVGAIFRVLWHPGQEVACGDTHFDAEPIGNGLPAFIVLSNNNLTVAAGAQQGVLTTSGNNNYYGRGWALEAKTSGSYYWEVTIDAYAGGGSVGISQFMDVDAAGTWDIAGTGNASFGTNGGQAHGAYSISAGQVIGFAVTINAMGDAGKCKVWMHIDGVWQAPGSPSNPAIVDFGTTIEASRVSFVPYAQPFTGDQFTFNFGGSSFAHTPPAGFTHWTRTHGYIGSLNSSPPSDLIDPILQKYDVPMTIFQNFVINEQAWVSANPDNSTYALSAGLDNFTLTAIGHPTNVAMGVPQISVGTPLDSTGALDTAGAGDWAKSITTILIQRASSTTRFGLIGSGADIFAALGSVQQSLGWDAATGNVYVNGIVVATYQTYTDGDLLQLVTDALDRLWLYKNYICMNGPSASPASGTGGFDFTVLKTGLDLVANNGMLFIPAFSTSTELDSLSAAARVPVSPPSKTVSAFTFPDCQVSEIIVPLFGSDILTEPFPQLSAVIYDDSGVDGGPGNLVASSAPMVVGAIGSSPGPSPYVGPLDLVPGAAIAFGQRAMTAVQRGSALYTIRRASDNATSIFNSDVTTGEPPLAAIDTFLSGTQGFVTSLNLADGSQATQATAGDQPEWVSKQTPLNGRPGIAFNSVTRTARLVTPPVTITGPAVTVFAVLSSQGTGFFGQGAFFGQGWETDAGGSSGYSNSLNTTINFNDMDVKNGWQMSIEFNGDLIEIGSDGVTSFALQDGDDSLPFTLTSNGTGVFTGITQSMAIGNDDATNPALSFNGPIFELLIYPSLLSADDRAAIRRNMADYYGIMLATDPGGSLGGPFVSFDTGLYHFPVSANLTAGTYWMGVSGDVALSAWNPEPPTQMMSEKVNGLATAVNAGGSTPDAVFGEPLFFNAQLRVQAVTNCLP